VQSQLTGHRIDRQAAAGDTVNRVVEAKVAELSKGAH
jgi:hypothetical protein